jgi:hypothetical protein
MDIYEWILLVSVAFCVGAWLWGRRIQRDIDEMQEEIHKLMSKIVFMRTETHGEVIYAYNAFNNEFVCQGKDLQELSDQFGIRYPDRKGIIVRPDEEPAK